MHFVKFKFNKKSWFALPLFLLACICALFLSYNRQSHLFEAYCQDLFQQEMTANTLSLHYTLKEPGNYSIYNYTPVLPIYQPAGEENSLAGLSSCLHTLENIKREQLKDNDRMLYDLLLRSLQSRQQLAAYPYYAEPLSPSSGMQVELPLLLAEYSFYTKKDVQDYLDLLDQYDEYLAGLLQYEKEKAAAGLFMSEETLQKLLEQCDSLLNAGELQAGTHFLQTTFQTRTQSLVDNGLISASEKEAFDHNNTRLLLDVVAPSYTTLRDGLMLLSDSCTSLSGLHAFEKGSDYYEQYFQMCTGSGKSPEAWENILSSELLSTYKELSALLSAHPEVRKKLADSSVFPYRSPDLMLHDLKKRMEGDFPELPVEITCSVKEVSDCLSPYTAPAYYLTPAIDNTKQNVIYINPKENADRLTLYTILAHEGFPGHLYQSVYSTEYLKKQDVPPIRFLLGTGGYVEGWALYVELLSYDYAAQIFQENNHPTESYCCQALKLNRKLQLALLSLLDIQIHYEGASKENVSAILSNFGRKKSDEIYEYIVEEPANYCKYFVGYMEITSLGREYKELHPDQASDYDFHRFLLECGSMDFPMIRQQMHLQH